VTRSRTLLYWLGQVVGWDSWSVLGLLCATPAWSHAVTCGGSGLAAIAWMHGYRRFIERRGWVLLGPGALVARVIPASLPLGIALPYTEWPLYMLTYREAALFGPWTLPAVVGTSWTVLVWNFAYFGIHYFQRWRQSEVDKLQLAVVAGEAQLHGLMAPIAKAAARMSRRPAGCSRPARGCDPRLSSAPGPGGRAPR
jgi:hypothetical protein